MNIDSNKMALPLILGVGALAAIVGLSLHSKPGETTDQIVISDGNVVSAALVWSNNGLLPIYPAFRLDLKPESMDWQLGMELISPTVDPGDVSPSITIKNGVGNWMAGDVSSRVVAIWDGEEETVYSDTNKFLLE